MATVEVIHEGRVVKDVVIGVAQPVTPSGALPPDIGWVQISTSDDRGSIWTSGPGDPTAPAGQPGDMYLDVDTGNIWRWDGDEWILQGTFAPGTDTPEEILAKLITVDGAGSLLDADTLDGHDSTYFATDADMNTAQGDITALQIRADNSDTVDVGQDADIAAIETNLALKANIASPTFTGDPKAPTPPPGDNDTSLATTQFVTAAITADITPWSEITGKPSTFPPTLPIAQSDVTGLVAGQAAQDTAIALRITDAPSDSLTYGRKNAAWATIVGGAIVSDTPPVGPAPGQMWYEADSGNTYIWYSDADSSQWVQQNIAAPISGMPSGLTADTRNRIVNGAFQISQENGLTGGTTNGFYPADQWYVSASGITFTTSKTTATTGSRVAISITTGKALAAGDYIGFEQKIEGTKIIDFEYGTSTAKAAVLQFDVRCVPAGTYSVALRNAASDQSFVASYTVAASATWTTISIPIPGRTTGTWLLDTSAAFVLSFVFACGTTFTAPATGWNAGNFIAAPGMTNGAATTSNSFYIRNVGLYLDPLNTGVPPRWEMLDEAEELRACQRYYEVLSGAGFGWFGTTTSTLGYAATSQFRVTKRAASPALTGTNLYNSQMPATVGTFVGDANAVRETRTANATGGGGAFLTTVVVNARM